jgi:hypothetical protein
LDLEPSSESVVQQNENYSSAEHERSKSVPVVVFKFVILNTAIESNRHSEFLPRLGTCSTDKSY